MSCEKENQVEESRERRRMAQEPLGYDHERRFEQHYPRIELPFQLVDTVETGVKKRYEKDKLFPNGLNRLVSDNGPH